MDHLRRWWRIFTRERVHVVLSDALFSEPLSAVRCDIRRGDRAARCLARVEAPANRSAHAPALRPPISHPRTTRQLAQVNRVLRILDLEPLLALPANTSTRPTSEDACMDARCDTMRNELRSSFFGAPRDAQSRRFLMSWQDSMSAMAVCSLPHSRSPPRPTGQLRAGLRRSTRSPGDIELRSPCKTSARAPYSPSPRSAPFPTSRMRSSIVDRRLNML